MLAALRSSSSRHFSSSPALWKQAFPGSNCSFFSSLVELNPNSRGSLDLSEVQKVLTDVKADDVRVIPVGERCAWADHMVIATGRSTWHVRNIAQALVYKAKQKQRGAKRMMLPSVQGEEGGKWIVIDSGKVIVHALDENARAYYNLENLWSSDQSAYDPTQAKQKQRGAKRMMLPSVQGEEGGKWIVIDSGKVIVHALDENARAYYNLENLWSSDQSAYDPTQDLEKAFTKVRPKNNSKRPAGNSSTKPAGRHTS